MSNAEVIPTVFNRSTATEEPALQAPLAKPRLVAEPRQDSRQDSRQDWALFLDIDGTLLRHVPDPRDAVVDDGLRDLLARMTERLDGAIAFVSGRKLSVIKEMLGPLASHAAGLYGLEMQWNGLEFSASPKEPRALTELARRVERLFAGEPGLVIEHKGPVLSLNTGKRTDLLAIIQPMAEGALGQLEDHYRIVVGHAGLELMPVAADKGAAISWFMGKAPFQARRPIFIGDDLPDERGFDTINAMGGLSVRVLPVARTEARYGIEDVDAVRDWLGDAQFPNLDTLKMLDSQKHALS